MELRQVIYKQRNLNLVSLLNDSLLTDAKFWVGRGQKPSPNGFRIFDENGKETPLRRYDRKTIVNIHPEN